MSRTLLCLLLFTACVPAEQASTTSAVPAKGPTHSAKQRARTSEFSCTIRTFPDFPCTVTDGANGELVVEKLHGSLYFRATFVPAGNDYDVNGEMWCTSNGCKGPLVGKMQRRGDMLVGTLSHTMPSALHATRTFTQSIELSIRPGAPVDAAAFGGAGYGGRSYGGASYGGAAYGGPRFKPRRP